jgi:MFS family permease
LHILDTITKGDLRSRQRLALSIFFFMAGMCYASWASRIPSIKMHLDINEAELGTLLLVMPISQMAGLPFSGWLVARFDSRWPMTLGFLLQLVFLVLIAFAKSVIVLAVYLFFFAFFTRIFSISMNTQSITLGKKFKKRINGSFHGLWSLGGIVGVGITTLMIAVEVDIRMHFLTIFLLCTVVSMLSFRNLLSEDKSPTGNKLRFGKPDLQILLLGVIIIFAAICEGGMFDWSGVYFKEVIRVEIFTAGYLIFMTCMATSRFVSDAIVNKLGMKNTYKFSAIMMTFGMLLAIIFPYFWTAMIGFSLVGFGTAAIFPMTFLLAGTSEKYSPGMAISLIATYALVGILIGPALIGYLAHAFNLRISFLFLALSGFSIYPVSRYYFSKFKSMN